MHEADTNSNEVDAKLHTKSSSSSSLTLKSSYKEGEGDKTQPKETLEDVAKSSPSLENLIPFPLEGEMSEASLAEESDKLWLWLEDNQYDESISEDEKKKAQERWDFISKRIEDVSLAKVANLAKNQPPKPDGALAYRWYTYCSKTPLGAKHGLEKYEAAINEIIKYTERDMSFAAAVFLHLSSRKDRLVSERFFFPWDWKTPWNKKDPKWTILDEAIKSMGSIKKVKRL